MKYSIIERDSFQLIGIKREFPLVNEEENFNGIPKLWDEVNLDGTSQRLGKLNNSKLKGLLGVCVDKRKNEAIDYWIATEYEGKAPAEFLSLTIPASKWVVFEVHGPMPGAMQQAWKQIFSEWFPASGYEHAGTPDLEVYADDNSSSPDYYSEIWIPVK